MTHLLQLEALSAARTAVSLVNFEVQVRLELETWCHVFNG